MDIHCSLNNSEQFNGTKVVLTKDDLSVCSDHLGLTFWEVAYGRFDCFPICGMYSLKAQV